MDELLEMARRLGRQIAAHERTAALKQAQQAVNEDAVAGQLVQDYHAQAQKIEKRLAERQPVEVEDKHKLRGLEEQLSTNAHLKELSRRQVDFVEMMRKIKEAIDAQLELGE